MIKIFLGARNKRAYLIVLIKDCLVKSQLTVEKNQYRDSKINCILEHVYLAQEEIYYYLCVCFIYIKMAHFVIAFHIQKYD